MTFYAIPTHTHTHWRYSEASKIYRCTVKLTSAMRMWVRLGLIIANGARGIFVYSTVFPERVTKEMDSMISSLVSHCHLVKRGNQQCGVRSMPQQRPTVADVEKNRGIFIGMHVAYLSCK